MNVVILDTFLNLMVIAYIQSLFNKFVAEIICNSFANTYFTKERGGRRCPVKKKYLFLFLSKIVC